jgi:hypothetical protein
MRVRTAASRTTARVRSRTARQRRVNATGCVPTTGSTVAPAAMSLSGATTKRPRGRAAERGNASISMSLTTASSAPARTLPASRFRAVPPASIAAAAVVALRPAPVRRTNASSRATAPRFSAAMATAARKSSVVAMLAASTGRIARPTDRSAERAILDAALPELNGCSPDHPVRRLQVTEGNAAVNGVTTGAIGHHLRTSALYRKLPPARFS